MGDRSTLEQVMREEGAWVGPMTERIATLLCEVNEGVHLMGGQRFGMIRFGSRLDVYLPEGVAPLVAVGQTTIAGETVIADLASDEGQRRGAIR